MAISKRTVLAAGTGFVVGLTGIAVAQAQGKKSSEVATMGEGEAVMIEADSQIQCQSHCCPT